jgi:hypothetical protein
MTDERIARALEGGETLNGGSSAGRIRRRLA